MIGRIIGAIIGGIITLASGYGIHKLVDIIINGLFTQNWLMVYSGAILYFFIGLFFLGIIIGATIISLCVGIINEYSESIQ